ncbi:hypothetical protein SANTM175S_04340 [Streptomyces antimycoticus]
MISAVSRARLADYRAFLTGWGATTFGSGLVGTAAACLSQAKPSAR